MLRPLVVHDEIHVLEEMGHAGFAVAFVAGADHVDHVDGDFGVGAVGDEEDAEAVGVSVFGDAGEGGGLADAGGEGLGGCEKGDGEEEGECAGWKHWEDLDIYRGSICGMGGRGFDGTMRMRMISEKPGEDYVALYHRAFDEFGAFTLWNLRHLETPTPGHALVVARALRNEGNLDARRLAEAIERNVACQ